MHRKPYQAGCFYPAGRSACEEGLKKCIPASLKIALPDSISAAIVPHAGWSFSGPTAGKVYYALSQRAQPDIFIIFGAVHVPGVNQPAIWKEGKWETPVGDVEIAAEFANELLKHGKAIFQDKPAVHLREHSIEVQMPFIQFLFPGSKVVPIMVPSHENAYRAGECAASLVNGKKIVALGSTDMTHYGTRFGFTPMGVGKKALEWVKQENDRRMLELITKLEAEKIVDEAENNSNACGAGAIAATVAFARSLKKTSGKVVEYTTSWDVYSEREIDTFVGYAGIVF
jgi:AmmeMemoRadiSam system protein B